MNFTNKQAKIIFSRTILIYCLFSIVTLGQEKSDLNEITFFSPIDSSYQPAMFYKSELTDARPLLVGLHTWSSDYTQSAGLTFYENCKSKNWNFIFPNLRGPNDHPESTGSEYVIADAKAAVEYCKAHANVDTNRIYLIGASGGGYTSLVLAAKLPEIWTAVSSWVPIVDLYQWLIETENNYPAYFDDIINSCGGDPRIDSLAFEECYNRSPINILSTLLNMPIDINTGINDGHTGSVPISHSLRAFNKLVEPLDSIPQDLIDYMVSNAAVPQAVLYDSVDLDYGDKTVLFRKTSNNKRITIFDGGHEIIYKAGVNWLSAQTGTLVSVGSTVNFEKTFSLAQNYPNPFNPTTTIMFSIPKRGYISLKVFDLLGREISTLLNEEKSVGIHKVKFDASNLSSALYFYRIQAEDYFVTKKMLLLK